MKYLKIVLVLCVAVSSMYGEELPVELERLTEQRARKIAEIDRIYLGELEALLAKYTRAGDLDSANKVKETIEDLRKDPESGVPETDAELTEFLSGTKWDFGEGKVLTFHPDGNIRKSWGILKPAWEVKKMKVIIGAGDSTVHFLKEFTEASKIDKRGVREYGKIVEED